MKGPAKEFTDHQKKTMQAAQTLRIYAKVNLRVLAVGTTLENLNY
jgi:hypothetical protein